MEDRTQLERRPELVEGCRWCEAVRKILSGYTALRFVMAVNWIAFVVLFALLIIQSIDNSRRFAQILELLRAR